MFNENKNSMGSHSKSHNGTYQEIFNNDASVYTKFDDQLTNDNLFEYQRSIEQTYASNKNEKPINNRHKTFNK